MQVRRWWYNAATMVVLASVQMAFAQAMPGPGASPADIKSFMSAAAQTMADADPPKAVEVREQIVNGVNAPGMTPEDQTRYASAVTSAFAPLIKSDKPQVRINATAVIAQMNSSAGQDALEQAMQSPTPAVRYWAAKGMAAVLAQKQLIPTDYAKVQTLLTEALLKEKEPLVGAALASTLSESGDQRAVPALTKYLSALASDFEKAVPAPGALVAGTEANKAIGVLARKGSTPLDSDQQKAAVQAIVNVLGLAAQHTNDQPSELSTREYARLLGVMGDTATATLNQLGAKTRLSWPKATGVDNTTKAALEITGVDGRPGKVAEAFEGVKPAPKL